MPSPFISAKDAIALVGQAVFLDARAGPDAAQSYLEAHITGALRVDLETDLSALRDPARGGRHPLPAIGTWITRLGEWGITPSTPVLIYDDTGGGMAAARAWWMLRAIGHEPLAVVDGGWQALCSAAAPTEAGVASATAVGPYACGLQSWPTVDADFVERIRIDADWCLIDARAPERYEGRTEPLDPVAGHIPGASNLYWKSQLSDDGRFESRQVLRDHFDRALGDTPPEHVVCYCGSGVTACHLLLTMEACGLRGAKLYVGSWSEWCRQGRPLGGR